MNTIKLRSRFALLLMILIAPFAGVSAAGLIDLNNTASGSSNTAAAADTSATNASDYVNSTVNGSANADLSGSASTNGSSNTANTNAGINTNVNAAIDGSLNGSTASNGDANTSVGATVSGNSSASASNGSDLITVSRTDADVMSNVGSQMSAGNVQSDSDLKTYAATQLRNDENLNSMAFGSDRIEVAYREPAHFLGFIPTSVNVNVVAHNDGTVDVDYPWYSFLMTTDRGGLEAAVKSEVKAYMQDNAYANANVNAASNASATSTDMNGSNNSAAVNGQAHWNASARAELATRIQAVLRSRLTSDSGTASSTQGSY